MAELTPKSREALRALERDLPDHAQRARLRQRVLAATAVAGGAALLQSSAQAAAAQAPTAVGAKLAGVSLGAKLSALPLGMKIGVTALTLVASAGLSARFVASTTPSSPQVQEVPSVASFVERVKHVERAAAAALVEPASAPIDTDVLREPDPPPPQVQAPPRAARTDVRTPQRVARPSPIAEATAPQMPTTLPAQANQPSPAPEPSTFRSRAEPPASTADLSAESSLLLEAMRAFEAGESCVGLRRLDQHALRFGSSALLATERERMRRRFAAQLADSPQTACSAAVEAGGSAREQDDDQAR